MEDIRCFFTKHQWVSAGRHCYCRRCDADYQGYRRFYEESLQSIVLVIWIVLWSMIVALSGLGQL